MKENIKKKIIALFGFLILIVFLSACSINDPRRELSRQLGIDLMNDSTTLFMKRIRSAGSVMDISCRSWNAVMKAY